MDACTWRCEKKLSKDDIIHQDEGYVYACMQAMHGGNIEDQGYVQWNQRLHHMTRGLAHMQRGPKSSKWGPSHMLIRVSLLSLYLLHGVTTFPLSSS